MPIWIKRVLSHFSSSRSWFKRAWHLTLTCNIILPKSNIQVCLGVDFYKVGTWLRLFKKCSDSRHLGSGWWKPASGQRDAGLLIQRERENLGYDSYHPALPGHVRSHWPEPSSRRVAPPLAHCGEFPGVSWFLAGTPTQCYNLSFAQYLHNSNWFPLCIWHMVWYSNRLHRNIEFIAVQCSADHAIK